MLQHKAPLNDNYFGKNVEMQWRAGRLTSQCQAGRPALPTTHWPALFRMSGHQATAHPSLSDAPRRRPIEGSLMNAAPLIHYTRAYVVLVLKHL